MANQPNLASGRGEVRPVSSERVRAIGWLLMGLLIGLLIGWVFWPVQWTDAEPDNLRRDARAHFISATADAYVASGGQDPNTALARMQSFADPQAAVADAIVYFQQGNDPKQAIRVVNLRSLSSALGASALGSTLSTFSSAQSAESDRPAISWTNWLLGILTGLLLLLGGWRILRRWLVNRASTPQASRPSTPASQGAWVPPLPPVAPTTPPPTGDGGWQPSTPPDRISTERLDYSAPAARSVQMETWDDPGDAPAFIQPAVDSAAPISARSQPPSTATDDGEPLYRITPGQEKRTSSRLSGGEEERAGVNDFIDYSNPGTDAEDEDDESEESVWTNWNAADAQPETKRVFPSGLDDDDDDGAEGLDEWDDEEDWEESSDEDPAIDSDEDEWDREEDTLSLPAVWPGGSKPAPAPLALPAPDPEDEEDTSEPGILPTVQSVLSSLGWGQKESVPKNRDGKEIGSYVAEYNIGIMAYDQSFTISAAGGTGASPLGACGMAISEELDKNAANSNNVRVLQVWLYDGLEVRTSSQYLVSPGLDKEALGEQAKSAGTITGEPLDIAPGVTFRIPAKNLVLDCRIVNADFLTPDSKPSPLRTVRVELKAKAAK